jgi:hypothetical protein
MDYQQETKLSDNNDYLLGEAVGSVGRGSKVGSSETIHGAVSLVALCNHSHYHDHYHYHDPLVAFKI